MHFIIKLVKMWPGGTGQNFVDKLRLTFFFPSFGIANRLKRQNKSFKL